MDTGDEGGRRRGITVTEYGGLSSCRSGWYSAGALMNWRIQYDRVGVKIWYSVVDAYACVVALKLYVCEGGMQKWKFRVGLGCVVYKRNEIGEVAPSGWCIAVVLALAVMVVVATARTVPSDASLKDQKNFLTYGGVGGFSGLGTNGLPFGGLGGGGVGGGSGTGGVLPYP
ncbi:glycine-rich protein 5 [Senna tora]|uniref:Glycine-rich protein 5 n=1 Tax=Senna tora TaxID=362788 RepID=A0A834SJ63_9FABA|nr:glycine-rich protein 5 [Senna tora]